MEEPSSNDNNNVGLFKGLLFGGGRSATESEAAVTPAAYSYAPRFQVSIPEEYEHIAELSDFAGVVNEMRREIKRRRRKKYRKRQREEEEDERFTKRAKLRRRRLDDGEIEADNEQEEEVFQRERQPTKRRLQEEEETDNEEEFINAGFDKNDSQFEEDQRTTKQAEKTERRKEKKRKKREQQRAQIRTEDEEEAELRQQQMQENSDARAVRTVQRRYVPLFWHVPRSGGGTVAEIAASCLDKVLASSSATSPALFDRWDDPYLAKRFDDP